MLQIKQDKRHKETMETFKRIEEKLKNVIKNDNQEQI
jgi:hypothetical protein